MLKKHFVLFLFLVMNLCIGYANDGVVLDDIFNPNKIEIYQGRLYVAQGASFYIYSLDDLRLIKTFGREGEGPGELIPSPYVFNDINQYAGQIFVQGERKVIYFSKDGDFLKEAKKNRQYFKMAPFGKGYVINALLDEERVGNKVFSGIKLIGEDDKVIKEVYKQESPLVGSRGNSVQNLPMFADTPHFAIYQNKLFVEKSNLGLKFEVFNKKGDQLFEINSKVDPVPVTIKDKERALKAIKNDKTIRAAAQEEGGWERFRKRFNFIFPEFFPVMADFVIDEDLIYIQTFEVKDDKTAYLIMDMKGKILKKVFLPNMADIPFTAILVGQEFRLYKIHKGVFYYLKDNLEEETWEFHSLKI